jgi:ABC-type glycerol-3-phosphate transport system substrate-binding protein
VAKRDNPKVAEHLYTIPMPKGPKGRYAPYLPFIWGVWGYSKNKSAAKSLLAHLSTREAIQQLVAASQGFDLPPFVKFNDFPTWAEQGPPKGTIYNYPSRGDQVQVITASPAPPPIAAQIYAQATMPRMIARYVKGGSSMDQAMTWAEGEIEGYNRT